MFNVINNLTYDSERKYIFRIYFSKYKNNLFLKHVIEYCIIEFINYFLIKKTLPNVNYRKNLNTLFQDNVEGASGYNQ